MKTMTYGEAIREAMSIRMREDKNVILFGEDVGAFGGCFGVSAGMFQEFGEAQIKDTPISEGVIVGAAVGGAATGIRPICELMFMDFLTVGLDQLVNQAAKMRYMFGGHIHMPMVCRIPSGAGISAAAQHSQSLESWCTAVPGLKVVYPSTSQDALGLLLSSIDDDNPVVFVEHKVLYSVPGDVASMDPIPLGKADIKRAGNDVTVVATGRMVHESLKAAEALAGEGIDVEVLDPRTLFPLDKEAIKKSVEKTHKVVVFTEESKRSSFASEVCAYVAEDCFDSLDAPVMRIGALNSPVPFSPPLEQFYIPNDKDLVATIKKMV